MPEHRRQTVNKLLRLLPEEAETLRRAAEALGMSESQLLRLLCRQAMFLTVSLIPSGGPDLALSAIEIERAAAKGNA